jgi:hypothetical protein
MENNLEITSFPNESISLKLFINNHSAATISNAFEHPQERVIPSGGNYRNTSPVCSSSPMIPCMAILFPTYI